MFSLPKNNYKAQPVLSIAIPMYNGEEFLTETIESIINQERFNESELIFSDDNSTDNSCSIVENYIKKYPNIRLHRNNKNVGMDENFERVVNYTSGDYFWFSGQDDIFLPGALKKVLNILESNPVDFIFMNYSQYNHDLSKIISPKVIPIEHDIVCKNTKLFFQHTQGILPGFLPSYILKKHLWNLVDKKPYRGTIFVQIGVFLELLPRLETMIIAQPYIKGRIPDNKWQKDNLALLDVFSGHLELIHLYHHKNPEYISSALLKKEMKRSIPVIYRRIVYLNLEKRAIDPKIKKRLRKILKYHNHLIIFIISVFPTALLELIVKKYFILTKK